MLSSHRRRVERLDKLYMEGMDKLARDVLGREVRRFQKWYPEKELGVYFGNGTSLVQVDGEDRWEDKPGECAGIFQAIEEIECFTDGYKWGCPDDVEVGPAGQGRKEGR